MPPAEPEQRGWQRSVWVTAVTQFFTLLAFGVSMPFLPLYVQTLGVTDRSLVAIWAGALAGAAALTQAVVAPIWGALADRFGRKPMLVRSMLAGAALFAAMGYVTDVWQLLGLRIMQGAMTGSQAAAAALVAAAAPTSQVGFSLGMVNMAIQLGNFFGPGLGGLAVGGLGFRGSFLLGAAFLFAAGVLAIFWVDEPPRPRRTTGAAKVSWVARTIAPFRWPAFRPVLLLNLGTQFVFGSTVAMLPLYLQELQRPEWLSVELAAGLGFSLTGVAAAIATPLLGRRVDRFGPHGTLAFSLLLLTICMVPHAFVSNAVGLLALRLGVGVCLAGTTAALAVQARLVVARGKEGAAFGAASTAQSLGWGLGPLLGALFAAVFGIPALHLVAAAIAGGMTWWVMTEPRRAAQTARAPATATRPRVA